MRLTVESMVVEAASLALGRQPPALPPAAPHDVLPHPKRPLSLPASSTSTALRLHARGVSEGQL